VPFFAFSVKTYTTTFIVSAAVFGKRIIMAVKQGGSPDPNSNRMLGDIIKQAKTNNVPVDVRN